MERTKTAITEAFQELLEETPINKITVKSIVERCGINRNTFYYYFDGIPDLVEYRLTAMADQLLDSFKEPNPGEELERVVTYFVQRTVFAHIGQDRGLRDRKKHQTGNSGRSHFGRGFDGTDPLL